MARWKKKKSVETRRGAAQRKVDSLRGGQRNPALSRSGSSPRRSAPSWARAGISLRPGAPRWSFNIGRDAMHPLADTRANEK